MSGVVGHKYWTQIILDGFHNFLYKLVVYSAFSNCLSFFFLFFLG